MKKVVIVIFIMLALSLSADIRFAKDLFEDGLYDEAIIEFEKIIVASPTSDEAQEAIFYIGESYREREQFARAEITYKRLLDGYPASFFRDKTLYYLALVQFKQKKFQKAVDSFGILIEKYPLSQYAKQSLSFYVQCFFELGEYNKVIVRGRKITRDYKEYHNIPEIYLWMAKAYFANNIPFEGRKTLDKIITEYPDHNARWKALELEIDLIEQDKDEKAASEELSKRLDEDISRIYEEKLRLKLVTYFISLGEFEQAYIELNKLIGKFGNSVNLDKYIILFSECQLKLAKFNELINNLIKFKKVFKESPLKADYNLYLAQAHFHLKDYSKSNNIVEDILTYTKSEKTIYETYLLKSHILKETGKLNEAIKLYKKLINKEYADNAELFFTIGDIYFEKIQNYSTAIKYYQRVVTGYSSKNYQQKASYKIALCYEKLDKFSDAIAELDQINLNEVTDMDLHEKILHKKKYLKKFKQKDYETAFEKLVNSLVRFSQDNDKNQLQEDLISILITDLKEYEKTIDLINIKDNPEGIYRRAKLFLIITEKLNAEEKYTQAKETFTKAGMLISKLDKTTHDEWITELNLRREIISDDRVNSEIIPKLEEFVQKYPKSFASNEFVLEIGNYYRTQNNMKKAASYFEKLINYSEISNEDFYNAKIDLAEYYYSIDDDNNALKNYMIADSQINLKRPLIYFHYAVILHETGKVEKAKNKLTFLVNNSEYYEGYDNTINFFSRILRKSGDFEDAIKYNLLIPVARRNDNFYFSLADDYLKINNKEEAKETLMFIVNKDNDILRKLADLQFETGDLEMAKYTFEELTKKEKSNLRNYEMLGRIAFIQDDFLEVAVNYKKIIDKLGDKFKGYDSISQVAKENIISLYRIENRPKAEKLINKFKRILSISAKHEIELSRGIYYSTIDKKKAESIFTKLLKQKQLSGNVMIGAYFWRGVVRLEMKKTKEAESDFEIVANSIDENLSNQANLKLGTINFSNEKYQKALNYYYKVIKNDKTGKLALDAAQNFAYVCKTIGEWQKAVAAYEIILERWGDVELEAKTVFDIAFCHFRDKKYQNAIKMFERSIHVLKDRELEAEAQYWIGESYFGMDDYETAVSEFLKVGYSYQEFTQWAASAELRAGEAYVNMKKIDKAKRMYERIISKYGKFSQWGVEANKRLEALK